LTIKKLTLHKFSPKQTLKLGDEDARALVADSLSGTDLFALTTAQPQAVVTLIKEFPKISEHLAFELRPYAVSLACCKPIQPSFVEAVQLLDDASRFTLVGVLFSNQTRY